MLLIYNLKSHFLVLKCLNLQFKLICFEKITGIDQVGGRGELGGSYLWVREAEYVLSSTERRGVELAAELALLDVEWQRRAMWDAKQEAGVRRL